MQKTVNALPDFGIFLNIEFAFLIYFYYITNSFFYGRVMFRAYLLSILLLLMCQGRLSRSSRLIEFKNSFNLDCSKKKKKKSKWLKNLICVIFVLQSESR